VAEYARGLLDVELPWTRMRQVYRLLGLARRHGGPSVDAACAKLLAVEPGGVVDLRRVTRILDAALEHAVADTAGGRVVVQAAGRFAREVLATTELANDAFGYKRMLAFAVEHGGHRRVWAIEGTGSFGAGLSTFLLENGEWVTELDHPTRSRTGAKTDELDAIRAAREALTRDHLAQPRQRGDREAMRVLLTTRAGTVTARTKAICQLKALIVGAPQGLREQLRRGTTDQQLDRCARLRTTANQGVEHRCTVRALRTCARQALFLQAQAADLETELEDLVKAAAPQLLDLPGVGVITAAQILISWSHPGRIRTEAAFAALAGVAPLPASSGQTVRHRLNRSGDRQLNRALHTIVLSRMTHHDETKAYTVKRTAEGKTPREIKRCLKRAVARQVYRLLETPAREQRNAEPAGELTAAASPGAHRA